MNSGTMLRLGHDAGNERYVARVIPLGRDKQKPRLFAQNAVPRGFEDGQYLICAGIVRLFFRVLPRYFVLHVLVGAEDGVSVRGFHAPIGGSAGAFIHDDELGRTPALPRAPQVAPKARDGHIVAATDEIIADRLSAYFSLTLGESPAIRLQAIALAQQKAADNEREYSPVHERISCTLYPPFRQVNSLSTDQGCGSGSGGSESEGQRRFRGVTRRLKIFAPCGEGITEGWIPLLPRRRICPRECYSYAG